ncbi:MAG: proprotein convertase P-domain-containing protein, partial [Thermoanaerobaculia bacterium]
MALAGLAIAGFSSAPARAIVYTYENTTAGNIPELGTDAACNGVTALVRTFTVPDSFTVSTIALGLNITHTDRGQVRAILNSPTGTSLVFLTQDAGDGNANYDVYLSPLSDGGGTNPVNDGDDDPVSEPYYHRLVNIASGFYTGNASASGGVWTLRVCDRDNAGGLGTLNRARLVLTSAAAFTPVCSSRTGFDFCPGCAASPPAAATSTAFPGGGVTNGNVTLTLTNSTLTDGTPSARNFSRVNTQTGGEFGYYVTEFDADATEVELVRSETSWAFSVPVNDLQWVQLDEDRSSWEDYVRVRGLRNGNEVRYSISTSAVPSYQISGELLETDSDSTPPDTFGNAFWNFDSAVSSIRSEYWAGDDFNNPNQQFIGYGSGLYCAYDFGDAPLTYGSAGQLLGDRTLYLGAVPPDGEAVTPAAPNAAATTDDITVASGSIDDEDGVPSFPNTTIVAGGTYT